MSEGKSSETSRLTQAGVGEFLTEANFCDAISENSQIQISASEIPEFVFQNWQVQGLVEERVSTDNQSELSASMTRLKNSTGAIRAFSKIQLKSMSEVCESLSGEVRYSLLKSSALRAAYYTNPHARIGWDIDIAVDKQQLPLATEVLLSLGYEFAQFDSNTKRFSPADPVLRAYVESQHYELGFLVRRNRVLGLSDDQKDQIRSTIRDGGYWHIDENGDFYCYTTIDVHHGLSLELPVTQLIEDGQSHDFGQQTVTLPSPSWLAYHVIYKLYWEGVHAYGKGLYQYADLIRIVLKLDEREQSNLIERLESSNLGIPGLYTLRRLPKHFGMDLPDTLAEYVGSMAPRVGVDPLQKNDLGDMWEKIWGRYEI